MFIYEKKKRLVFNVVKKRKRRSIFNGLQGGETGQAHINSERNFRVRRFCSERQLGFVW